MSKSITFTIDLSGRGRDSHGEVESTPKVNVSSHGLDTVDESNMLGALHEAIIKIIKPKPVTD